MDMNPEDMALQLRHVPEWLECPICDNETRSLKEFRMPDEYFALLFYHTWTMIDIVACPSCMRKQILRRLGTMVISTNLTWPVITLPIFSFLMLKSMLPGHSASIQKEFREAYELAKRRAQWAKEDEAQANS